MMSLVCMQTTRFDLLRHGEPVGGSKYRGNRIDDPLTEKGWRQMWAGVGEQETWDVVVSSPLLRCADFAKRLSKQREIPLVMDERFREIGFGAWEGKTKQELRNERHAEFEAFYADPVNNTPEGAEPVPVFFSRIADALDDLRSQHAGKKVLLVAHAGVIRAAVTHVIGAPVGCMYQLNVLNGYVSRIGFAGNQGRLERLNVRL